MSEANNQERRLCLYNNSILSDLVFHILRFNREDKGKSVDERKPIMLYINSECGSISDGFGLIDVILQSKTPVYTVNQGVCGSVAFLVFLAGQRRFTMEHSQFSSGFSIDSTVKTKERLEFEANKLDKMTRKYILDRTDISEDLYEKKCRTEWYFLSDEAKDLGVATDIVFDIDMI